SGRTAGCSVRSTAIDLSNFAHASSSRWRTVSVSISPPAGQGHRQRNGTVLGPAAPGGPSEQRAGHPTGQRLDEPRPVVPYRIDLFFLKIWGPPELPPLPHQPVLRI